MFLFPKSNYLLIGLNINTR